jgi:hypothetical protein
MTALQLQRLLDRAELSQRGAAKALDINERTMRKYAAGDSKIPKTVELPDCQKDAFIKCTKFGPQSHWKYCPCCGRRYIAVAPQADGLSELPSKGSK